MPPSRCRARQLRARSTKRKAPAGAFQIGSLAKVWGARKAHRGASDSSEWREVLDTATLENDKGDHKEERELAS